MNKMLRPVIAAGLFVLAVSLWFLTGAGEKPERWLGYVEGETLYIAAPVSGRLAERAVDRGQRVAVGDPLFSLDPETVDADTERLKAQVAAARAQVQNLEDASQREAELDVSRASEAAAKAELTRAQRELDRIAALADKGFASKAQLDTARAARDAAKASLAQAQARIRSGELTAGRTGQLRAAKAEVGGARAALRGQEQVRADIAPVSPSRGIVEQTFYNPGEWVTANSPVVSVLPDAKRKLRFFVPEDRVSALETGRAVRFTCDGCEGGMHAKISYISPRAEFTPPVIYSEKARSKLVFMVEAILPEGTKPLPLGLPVEIAPQ